MAQIIVDETIVRPHPFSEKSIRDGAKFMGYPGRVLGKYRFEKKSWPPFFIMKKSLGPSYFYVKKVLAPRFFQGKKS